MFERPAGLAGIWGALIREVRAAAAPFCLLRQPPAVGLHSCVPRSPLVEAVLSTQACCPAAQPRCCTPHLINLCTCPPPCSQQWLDELLPEDAAERCRGRVRLVVTEVPSLRLRYLEDFESKEDLIDACSECGKSQGMFDWCGQMAAEQDVVEASDMQRGALYRCLCRCAAETACTPCSSLLRSCCCQPRLQ